MQRILPKSEPNYRHPHTALTDTEEEQRAGNPDLTLHKTQNLLQPRLAHTDSQSRSTPLPIPTHSIAEKAIADLKKEKEPMVISSAQTSLNSMET